MSNIKGATRVLERLIAVLGSLLGLIALFQPDLRRWFADHGLAGWIIVILLIAVGPFLATLASRKSAGTGAKDSEAEAIERSKVERKLDCDLIWERLDNWKPQSAFHDYLRNDVTHTRLPIWLSDDIELHCRRWAGDSREVRNDELRAAFESTHEAAKAYDVAINDHLYTRETGSGATFVIDDEHLMLSPELKRDDPQRFYDVDNELHEKRIALVQALEKLFRELWKAKSP